MKKSNTQIIIVVLGLILLALLACIVYLTISINKSVGYIVSQRELNAKDTQDIRSVSDLKNKIQEAEEISKSFDSLYIDHDVLSFIELIESVAAESGANLVIDNVAVDDEHKSDKPVPYGKLNMVLTVTGSWNAVTNFLVKVENLPYSVNISSARLVTVTGDSGLFWSMSLALVGITN